MGLLDDAIREHLELKRRHGASDDEVERKAAEAFGPVRRERAEDPIDEPLAGAEPLAHADAQPADAYAVEPQPEPELELEDAPDPYAGMPAYDESLAAEPAPAPVEPHDAPPEPVDAGLEPPDDAPEPLDPGEPAIEWDEPEPPPGGTPPRGFPAVAGESGEPDADDVLEETPDFLQDAPEHDRLWFEQRPPRDFDFDE